MGNEKSLPLAQVPPGFPTMCISLDQGNGITVLHSDSESLSAIRQAIIDAWPNGIQREMAICGTGWMFNVKGNLSFMRQAAITEVLIQFNFALGITPLKT